MNTNINPFSEYGYQPQSGWTGRIMQLNEQGVDTQSTVNFGKGFEPENPFLNPKDAFTQEVVDIAATVTDDELKSLFGEMPFGMTHRQALQEQIAAAYSVENGEKHVDFSKLQAIGNGQKVSTIFFEDFLFDDILIVNPNINQFGSNATLTSTVYFIFFTEKREIKIIDTKFVIEELTSEMYAEDLGVKEEDGACYGYLTIRDDGGSNSLPIGSFSLKTRSTDN